MLRFLRTHQRGVVFRLGRFARVAGPGLDRTLPGWQALSEPELTRQVEFVILHYRETPVGLSQGELAKAMEEAARRDAARR